MNDTTALLAQIDRLAKSIDDTTAAELETVLGHAFEDGMPPGSMAPSLGTTFLDAAEKDYRSGFLGGMVWAIVLYRRGSTMLGLMRLPDAEVLRQAADIFERHHGDMDDGVAHSLMCLARSYHDGIYKDGE